MNEALRDNFQGRIFISLLSILIIYFILSGVSESFNFLPYQIAGMSFPANQTNQILIIFPLIIMIIYLLFIRSNYIRWKNIGFSMGEKGFKFTFLLGIIGGLVIGIFDYFVTNHFVLESNQIIPNFFEKCISAPIWEEFFFRVIILGVLETVIIVFVVKIILDDPKNKIKDSFKKWILYVAYILIIVLSAYLFAYAHNSLAINVFLSGIISAIVYLKSRSIVAPIVVHLMSNFVTGGFLFLILHGIL